MTTDTKNHIPKKHVFYYVWSKLKTYFIKIMDSELAFWQVSEYLRHFFTNYALQIPTFLILGIIFPIFNIIHIILFKNHYYINTKNKFLNFYVPFELITNGILIINSLCIILGSINVLPIILFTTIGPAIFIAVFAAKILFNLAHIINLAKNLYNIRTCTDSQGKKLLKNAFISNIFENAIETISMLTLISVVTISILLPSFIAVPTTVISIAVIGFLSVQGILLISKFFNLDKKFLNIFMSKTEQFAFAFTEEKENKLKGNKSSSQNKDNTVNNNYHYNKSILKHNEMVINKTENDDINLYILYKTCKLYTKIGKENEKLDILKAKAQYLYNIIEKNVGAKQAKVTSENGTANYYNQISTAKKIIAAVNIGKNPDAKDKEITQKFCIDDKKHINKMHALRFLHSDSINFSNSSKRNKSKM